MLVQHYTLSDLLRVRTSISSFIVVFLGFQPELLKSLSDVLKTGTNSPVARMQAGLQLKNALYSKDANVKLEYQQRWLQFPEDVRNFIKINVCTNSQNLYSNLSFSFPIAYISSCHFS